MALPFLPDGPVLMRKADSGKGRFNIGTRRLAGIATALCVVLVLLGIYFWPPAPLPDGRAADTRAQFAERKDILERFDQPLPPGVWCNDARAREMALKETIPRLRERVANTTVTYDFLWRVHEDAALVARRDLTDEEIHPLLSIAGPWPARRFISPGDRDASRIRPGLWVNRSLDRDGRAPDYYVIRTIARFRGTDNYRTSEARFRLPPSLGVAAIELWCVANEGIRQENIYGYCTTPAPHGRYDLIADAPLLDRLARLQSEGPGPILVDAKLSKPLGDRLASGMFAAELEQDAVHAKELEALTAPRKRRDELESYTTLAIIGLVLLGVPGLGAWLAFKRRRRSATRVGSGLYGAACIALALVALWLSGKVGPWGLIVAMVLWAFSAACVLAGVLAIAGALRRETE